MVQSVIYSFAFYYQKKKNTRQDIFIKVNFDIEATIASNSTNCVSFNRNNGRVSLNHKKIGLSILIKRKNFLPLRFCDTGFPAPWINVFLSRRWIYLSRGYHGIEVEPYNQVSDTENHQRSCY